MKQTVPLDAFMREYRLTLLTRGVDTEKKFLESYKVNRPGLQLAGFFHHFDAERIQILGLLEYAYLNRMDEATRMERLQRLFSYKIPAVVLCRDLHMLPEMPRLSEEFNVPILRSSDSTTDFVAEISRWLKVQFAPQTQVHGVLLDVYGVGILIMGESGVGKSETALEMIKRGHRFVADDAVIIRRVSQETLVGSCPENIRYFLELRGIGIIDIRHMYGVESIRETQSIDLVIKLEIWNDKTEYDRIGIHYDYTEILGNRITCHSIPIRPGRNLAIICEAAAINHRQRKMGYNAAHTLTERLIGNNEKQ
jgi:HPr kinase/phosphorylase